MRYKWIVAIVLMMIVAVPLLFSQGPTEPRPFISVSSTAKVKAKPDVSVAVLEIRSSAPLATDALQQNDKRIAEITAKLRELGVKDEDIHFSGNQFTPSGGGRMYMPSGQRPTGFEVYNVFEVRIRDGDLSNLDAFGKKAATLLDELGKLGAGILSPDLARFSLGSSSAVVFALDRPEVYEKQAYEKAIEKARPVAEEIAKKMGVKITGIHSIHYSSPVISRPQGGYELDFAYFASSPEDLSVRATVVVNFSFK